MTTDDSDGTSNSVNRYERDYNTAELGGTTAAELFGISVVIPAFAKLAEITAEHPCSEKLNNITEINDICKENMHGTVDALHRKQRDNVDVVTCGFALAH